MTSNTLKSTLAGSSIGLAAGSSTGTLAAILKTLRMIGSAWEGPEWNIKSEPSWVAVGNN